MRHSVFKLVTSRFLLCAISALLWPHALLRAQDEDDVPLGDLAREFRQYKAPEHPEVIDNDNLMRVMDKAESERLEGKPISSVSPMGTFTTVSADGSCSLSFDARSANHNAAAFIASDLPQDELAKVEGPAEIRDGQLVVSVHNHTQWELKEIVVDVSTLPAEPSPPEYRFATLELPNSAPEKFPDQAERYHLKGTAAPDSIAIFQALIGADFDQSANWHWTIISARGIPPAASARTLQSADRPKNTLPPYDLQQSAVSSQGNPGPDSANH